MNGIVENRKIECELSSFVFDNKEDGGHEITLTNPANKRSIEITIEKDQFRFDAQTDSNGFRQFWDEKHYSNIRYFAKRFEHALRWLIGDESAGDMLP